MAWTPPLTWTAGPLTSTDLNEQVRDNLLALSTWSAWTPTLGGSWVLGNGTLTGGAIKAGDLVLAWFQFTVGSSTTKSGQLELSLPFTAAKAGTWPLGLVTCSDTSASSRAFRVAVQTATNAMRFGDLSDTRVSNTVPFTWDDDDVLRGQISYEAA